MYPNVIQLKKLMLLTFSFYTSFGRRLTSPHPQGTRTQPSHICHNLQWVRVQGLAVCLRRTIDIEDGAWFPKVVGGGFARGTEAEGWGGGGGG